MELNFQYSIDIPSYDTQEVYFVRPHKVINWEHMLLESLYYDLSFPHFTEFEWAAFDEGIKDLSWINEKKIVLFHDKLPNIKLKALRVYLEKLNDAVIHWTNKTEHDFEVIFMETDRSRILKVINSDSHALAMNERLDGPLI